MRLRFVFCVLTLLFANAITAKTIYKSVDQDGNVSLSDRPFPHAEAFTIDEPDDSHHAQRAVSHSLTQSALLAAKANINTHRTTKIESAPQLADNISDNTPNTPEVTENSEQSSQVADKSDDSKDDSAENTVIKDAALKQCHDAAVRSVLKAYPCDNTLAVTPGNDEESLRIQREQHECSQRQQIALAAMEVTYERSCKSGGANFSQELTQ